MAATLVVLAPNPAQAAPTVCTDLEIDAHRGYHYPQFDENSMRGMAEAANRGYAIETDVWADAQGQLWLFHDRDVSRTTGTEGYIDEMTTAQVSALRYKKAGSPLPRLEEALALWQTFPSTRIYVEPKQREETLRIAQMVRDAGLVSRFYFTEYAAYLNKYAPDVLLQRKSFNSNPDPSELVAGGVDSLQVGVEQLTAADVDSYHAVGIEVQTKTTNATTQWRDAVAKGFDGVLTDSPNELKEFCPYALLPPDVTSFAPNTGPVGTVVTITGSNFYDATGVRFGTALAEYTVDSPTEITATVPSTTRPGPVQIRVVNRNGEDLSDGSFTLAAPVISSFTPTQGPAGTAVTITGANLTGATSVEFGSTEVPSFTVDSDSQITATAPAGLPAESTISVTTPGGTVSSADRFTTTPPGEPTVPGAPTQVTATAGNAQASVSWTPPASDGGSALTGYTVTSSPGGVTTSVGPEVTATTITGLGNGTTYTFTVKATNAIGDSAASDPSNQVTPLAPVAPPSGPDPDCVAAQSDLQSATATLQLVHSKLATAKKKLRAARAARPSVRAERVRKAKAKVVAARHRVKTAKSAVDVARSAVLAEC